MLDRPLTPIMSQNGNVVAPINVLDIRIQHNPRIALRNNVAHHSINQTSQSSRMLVRDEPIIWSSAPRKMTHRITHQRERKPVTFFNKYILGCVLYSVLMRSVCSVEVLKLVIHEVCQVLPEASHSDTQWCKVRFEAGTALFNVVRHNLVVIVSCQCPPFYISPVT